MGFEIEKDVPIPPGKKIGPAPKTLEVLAVLMRLEVGDSFVLDAVSFGSVRARVYAARRREPVLQTHAYTFAKCDTGTRVWRTA